MRRARVAARIVAEPVVDALGAPLHLEPAGQLAFELEAALEAGEHRLQERVELRLHRLVAGDGGLVAAHQFGDGHALRGGDLQEIGGVAERMRVALRAVVGERLALAHDESAADREPCLLGDGLAAGVESGEHERVGMARRRRDIVEHNVAKPA